MGDDFPEIDPDIPTEHDIDEAYGSQYLGVTDVGDRKIRTRIVKTKKEQVRDRESGKLKKRIVVFFENVAKPLILNATNLNTLIDALGRNPANWLNASIGIWVDPSVAYAGKKTGGVRLRVLGPAVKPKPAAQPAPKPTKPASEEGWSDAEGDPGAFPDPDRELDAA